jgi:hypothetical protein
VHKGSDILKLDYLIADPLRNDQKDFVRVDSEIRTFQNNKNSFDYEFYKKLSEEKSADFVAGENTYNNEIQLENLLEDFIRELEKENYESNGMGRKKSMRRRGI